MDWLEAWEFERAIRAGIRRGVLLPDGWVNLPLARVMSLQAMWQEAGRPGMQWWPWSVVKDPAERN